MPETTYTDPFASRRGSFTMPSTSSYTNPFSFYTPSGAGNRGYGQISDSVQTGTSWDQTLSQSFGGSNYSNWAQNFGETYGLTSEQTQNLTNALSSTLGSSTTSSMPTNVQQVLSLLQSEQDYLDYDTSSAQQFLTGLLTGENLPTIDRDQYISDMNRDITTALGQAASQSQLSGLSETDADRLASFASGQVASDISGQILDAQTQLAINSLAAQVQGAETMFGGTAASRLFESVAPSLLPSLLGESTTTQTEEIAQTLQEQYGYSQTEAYEAASSMTSEFGQSEEFASSLVDAFSQSMATAAGRLYGIAPESGGGKFVCTVLCYQGKLDEQELQKEVKWFTKNLKQYKWSARGYLAIGPWLAKQTYKNPKIGGVIGGFVKKVVSCNAKKWDQIEPTFIEHLSFNTVRLLFALVGLCGFNRGKVDSEIINIMNQYYNPVNVEELYE